jgi:hypothetical protein
MTISTLEQTRSRLSIPHVADDRDRPKYAAARGLCRTLALVAVVTSLTACDVGPSIAGKPRPSSALQGTWIGETNGLVLTFTAGLGRCDWGCGADAQGTYLRRATGQTGSFVANSGFDDPMTYIFIKFLPTAYSSDIVFWGNRLDDTHIAGKLAPPPPQNQPNPFGITDTLAFTFVRQ